MSSCNAIGALAKLITQGGVGPRVFSSTSERIGFTSESLTSLHSFAGRQRGIGEIGPTDDASRRIKSLAYGAITMPASPEELHRWLPRAMWGTTTTTAINDTYELGLQASNFEFDTLVHRENGIFRYTNGIVNKLHLSWNGQREGDGDSFPTLTVEIAALLEDQITPWPAPEPSLTETNDALPYTYWETNLEINSVPICLNNFRLTIDNNLRPHSFASVTAQCLRSHGRLITLSGSGHFTAATQAEATAAVDTTANAIFRFDHTIAPMSTVFNFSKMRNTGYNSPIINKRGEIPIRFNMHAAKEDILGAELVVVNDHTP